MYQFCERQEEKRDFSEYTPLILSQSHYEDNYSHNNKKQTQQGTHSTLGSDKQRSKKYSYNSGNK